MDESHSDRAVNPVVGTIILVAIVVILSATVGTLLLAYTTDLGGGAQAALDLSHVNSGDGGSATVTVISMGSADHIDVRATTDESALVNPDNESESIDSVDTRLDSTGDSFTVRKHDANANDTVEVQLVGVAVRGGDEAVIFDEMVTI